MDIYDAMKKELAYFDDSVQNRINNFNIYKYIENSSKSSDDLGNGAVVVLTENQLITATTELDGCGTHVNTFACIMKLLKGDYDINFNDMRNRLLEAEELHKTFIHARLVCEKRFEKDSINNNIHFIFPREKISNKEFQALEMFISKYGEILEKYRFSISTEFKNFDTHEFDDFDTFLIYVKKRLRNDLELNLLENENIIGEKIDNEEMKKK